MPLPSSVQARLSLALVLSCLLCAVARAERDPATSALEREVFEALNEVRESPKKLVPKLKEYLTRFEGDKMRMSDTLVLATQEGPAAVKTAIRFLEKAKPVGTLVQSEMLAQAARDHQLEQASSGSIGHKGAHGSQPMERVKKHAKVPPRARVGETLSYGTYGGATGRDVVLSLIIDDGVSDRGHRAILFDPDYKLVGIACGSHAKFQRMCAMDFATKLDKK